MQNKQLSTTEELQQRLEPLVSAPGETAIFLDLDGTLAPIVDRPSDVAVPAAVAKLIRRLSKRYLAVVIVSGRQATEARRIVGIEELAYVGNHGFELMLPGHAVVVSAAAQPHVPAIRQVLKAAYELAGTDDSGVFVEDKTATLSLHYRLAPDPEAAHRLIDENIVPLAKELGLKVNEGRKVVEIKPPEKVDKGTAVGDLIDRLQARQALYAGDDTTDIDALRELRRRGGKQSMVGIGVASREMPATLSRHADLLIGSRGGVEEMLRLLAGEEP